MFITAPRIHNGNNWLPAGYAIETDDSGTILALADHIPEGTVHYEGVLCPGFVNVHCHTELSHMKGMIPEHTGLIPFLKTVPLHRNDRNDEEKRTARHDALDELERNGIVATGDIANTADTMDIRARDKLHFHTFVEAIGFTEANAERSFGYATGTYEQFKAQHTGKMRLRQSITPHAPYSVSRALFGLIDKHTGEGVMAIHNQESEAEGLFFRNKEGGVRELLSTLGIDDTPFTPTGLSSIRSYLQWVSPGRRFIFVHNTYTPPEDVQFVHGLVKEAYWCLCPNANLYIEDTLPDIPMLMRESDKLCIGTDSLASNHRLSIASELYSIKKKYPQIPWEALLRWATFNGACALNMQDIVGSFDAGKAPGILQITGLDTGTEPMINRVC